MAATGEVVMLSPIADRPVGADTLAPVRLERPLDRVAFGIEVDYAWESYRVVIDEWSRLLARDGAVPSELWVEHSRNDPVKKSAEQIRSDIADWSKLVECGVVGLGN
jgi:hypothetical protein